MIWFSSDTHFGHWKICQYCNRPFKTLKKMDDTLIRNINARVKPNDTLFFLGDFCFRKSSEAKNSRKNAFEYYRERIKCQNIIFISGNHDKNNKCKSIIRSLVIKYSGKLVNLVHDPKDADINYEINLVGHVHTNWQIKRIRKGFSFTDCINVGTDVWRFQPVSWNELMGRYNKWLKQINKN